MELLYGAQMRAEARAGQETHGSIGTFLRDTSASFKLVAMYVAEVLSVELTTRLVLVDDVGQDASGSTMRRALRGVHVTDKDAASVIVAVTLGERVSVDDCALFFQSAIYGWDHIVIARTLRSTLSDDLAAISSTRQIDWPIIHAPSIELFLTELLRTEAVEAGEAERSEEGEAVEAVEAVEAEEVEAEEVEAERSEEVEAGEAERSEEGEAVEVERSEEVEAERSDEGEAERSEEVEDERREEAEAGEAAEADGIEDAGFVARACARITEYARRNNGVLPTQNGPRRSRIGRTLQYLRSSRDILHPDDKALVESIPGWTWSVHGDKFHARLREFIAEVALHPSGPVSHRVRYWVKCCVRKRDRGELSQERIDILSATPGWVWQTRRSSA
jgi:hypothetical protein